MANSHGIARQLILSLQVGVREDSDDLNTFLGMAGKDAIAEKDYKCSGPHLVPCHLFVHGYS